MKLAMNSFPSGRYIEEGSIWQRLLNGIVVSIPMFCIGGAYRGRGYTERTSMRCSYRKSSLVMGKLLLLLLASVFLLLTACGGGGGSGDGGGPSLTTPGDTNITAQTNMSGDGDGPSLTTPGDTNTTAPTNMSGDGGGPSLTTPGDTNTTAPTNMSGDGGGPSLTTPGDTNTTAPTNMSGDGGGPPLLSNVELSISPVINGLRIQWHNLDAFERAGNPQRLSIKLTRSDTSIETEHTIAIADFLDGIYELTGLVDGVAYRFVEMIEVVYRGDVSYSRLLVWTSDENGSKNREDNNNNGIVVGANHDGDGRADTVDEDDDNDGRADDMDDCRLGDIGWDSTDSGLDNDADGCRDAGAEDSDDDNDRVMDDADVDDDGDGLIEISTPAELDAVRYQLDGTGLKLNATASLNITGCGDGEDRTSCNGYELVNNISLTDYIATTYPGDGWLPVGYDISRAHLIACDRNANSFSAIFEGNHFVISGLSINRPQQSCIGFFTYLGNGGEIRRLGLEADEIRGRLVGALVAHSHGIIHSSYAMVASLTSGANTLGGLVGHALNSEIDSSFAIITSLTGTNRVGGLLGQASFSNISSSYAVIASLNGGDFNTGGLVGYASEIYIGNSYAVVKSLTGGDNVGGLVGRNLVTEDHGRLVMDSSYAIVGSLNGDRSVGGLVGSTQAGMMTSSYAIFNTSLGDRYVGGLIGSASGVNVTSSYAIFNKLTSKLSTDDNGGGGLIGQAEGGRLISSYVIANSLEGDGHVGGFVGNSTAAFRVDSSYGVFGSLTRTANLNIDTLIGSYRSSPAISNSYWNSETTNLNTGTLGEPKSGSDLTGPTDYGGIYDAWDDGVDLDGGGVDDITIYCDSDLSGTIEAAERVDSNKIWDFGSTDEYPAIRCTPDNSPAAQRAWWSPNDRGEPTLDNERLDEVLDSHFP